MFAVLPFLNICQRFATTSENVLKTCIAFEQVSRWWCLYKIEFDFMNLGGFVIVTLII